ncbi:MAG TPA: type II toxin-antitoxin system RelE/ParE family toxin [Candidatus Acidoferrum sp.]|jgi:mRNA-degrading endonuclease RelE of RelBE toxin-antitoxin system|nr:type II toxin-antitoxin system RelE/ParE family toxin [Candidatus Acidoferrum sp.]
MKQKPKSQARVPTADDHARMEEAFQLRFTPDAAADIHSLDGSVRNQLRKVLENKLAVNPEGYGLPLRGALANFWKHEFGNHRVIYRIYPQLRVVAVCAVGIRKQGDAADIYRQLESVAKSGRLAGQLASVLKKILPGT